MPVQAAANVPTSSAAETVLESEEALNADSSLEGDASSEVVSETEVQAQEEDMPELAADSEEDTAPSDDAEQNTDTALAGNSDLKDNDGSVGDPAQEDNTEPVEDPAQEDNTEPVEDLTQEDSTVLSEDSASVDDSNPEIVEETISAEPVPVSNEEASYAAAAENAVFSASSKAATDLAEELTYDRIHFITLNGISSASDAILIESNGKYGLIDSSNPSPASASDDPDLAFTKEFIDTAANGLTVVKYLTDLNISHLDFVLGTHSHSDHVGGMPDIAESGLVNNNTVYIYKEYSAITGQEDWHNDYYADAARDAMRAKGAILLNVLNPSQKAKQALGATLERDAEDRVGDHLEFSFGDFLIRLYNLHTESTVNENLNSIITTVKKGDSSAILMADMEQAHYMESRTVDAILRNDQTFKADVYKAGHHGYYTSTSYDTIRTLKPENFIVSTNSTSLTPAAYTVFNYFVEKSGGKVYRTSENGPAVIADFGDQGVTILKPGINNTFTAAATWTAMITEGWHQWYPDEDSYNRTGLKWINFRGGAPLKGWFRIGRDWYLADENYALRTGWTNLGGKWYFLNGYGKMLTGWIYSANEWYYLNSDGVLQTGWLKYGDKWYYLQPGDGKMQTGWLKSGDKYYLFNNSGVMQTGWASYNGKWYFLNNNGVMQTGLLNNGGKWYLLGSDGAMQTGWQKMGGKLYYFNNSGVLQTGWIAYGGKWYFSNIYGVMQTGWLNNGGKWYLLDSDGAMQTGWRNVGGKTYYFNGSGVLQTGWIAYGGKWYFSNIYGVMQTGWLNNGGKWYLLGSDGAMLKGWQVVGGKRYFFNTSGIMQTGWVRNGAKWYYLESNGAMAVNKWIGDYYVKSDGSMAVNEWIGSYYVGADGKWIRGYKPAA